VTSNLVLKIDVDFLKQYIGAMGLNHNYLLHVLDAVVIYLNHTLLIKLHLTVYDTALV
jgi:hypothetical protein